MHDYAGAGTVSMSSVSGAVAVPGSSPSGHGGNAAHTRQPPPASPSASACKAAPAAAPAAATATRCFFGDGSSAGAGDKPSGARVGAARASASSTRAASDGRPTSSNCGRRRAQRACSAGPQVDCGGLLVPRRFEEDEDEDDNKEEDDDDDEEEDDEDEEDEEEEAEMDDEEEDEEGGGAGRQSDVDWINGAATLPWKVLWGHLKVPPLTRLEMPSLAL